MAKHLGKALGAQKQALDVFAAPKSALAQPSVYVHRDYMPRNLMVSDPNPGVLDFQDAVYGPITYDMVSLLRDAFISWEEERVLDWTVRYWEKRDAPGFPWGRLRRVLARVRMDGPAAPSEGARYLRASTTETASRSTWPTRRAF